MVRGWSGVLASVVVALTACTAAGPTSPTAVPAAGSVQPSVPGGSSAATRPRATPSYDPAGHARELAQIADVWGIDDPPEVAIVRAVTGEESAAVEVACMTQAGFPPEPDSPVLSWTVPEAQADAFHLAEYTCAAQYPVLIITRPPFTRHQVRIIYDWWVGPLADCVRAAGYEVPPAPSFESWAAANGDNWAPFDLVPPQDDEHPIEWDFNTECQVHPPDEILWP